MSYIEQDNKGIGELETLDSEGWNILAEEVSLPCAVIYQSRLEQNLNWMQTFANTSEVKLAPHGKTSMTPAFFNQQIAAGAWAITLATANQVVAAAKSGIKRIIMANQLVGLYNMKLIANLIKRYEVEFYCVVDSKENAIALSNYFVKQGLTLNVLIEFGVVGGRCGCRTEDEVYSLSKQVQLLPALALAGIEVYEGVIHGDKAEADIANFLKKTVEITESLIASDVFSQQQVVLTGAGSAWYDLVASIFGSKVNDQRILPVIRPGCYLIHDTGIYEEAQQLVLERGGAVCDVPGDLVSSLEVWAYVLSIPEPGKVIIGMGKRDVAFDAGLPTPVAKYQPGTPLPVAVPNNWKLLDIMDQHSFLSVPAESDISVGDMISFSTSHPCLTLDKWRKIAIANDNHVIVDVVDTCF